MREIEELLDLCRYAGSSLEMGQGAGGNASVKTADGVMWIKASGYRLSAVRGGYGYLPMRTPSPWNLASSVAGVKGAAANLSMSRYLQSLTLDSGNLRPSLETWFHALLDRAVLHTHAIYANAFACMQGGREELERLLAARPAWVSYQIPGHQLGEGVHRAVSGHQRVWGTAPKQLVLENHGLITAASSADEAIALTEEVVNAGRRFFGTLDDDALGQRDAGAALEEWVRSLRTKLATCSCVVRPARFGRLQGAQPFVPVPLTPDDVICNGRAIMNASDLKVLPSSAAILADGLGFVFLAPTDNMADAMEEQLLSNVLVRDLIRRRGEFRMLPQEEMPALLEMESEKYRQKVLAAEGNACR
jgi:rhamnose utilization protein RhaD (predicted bifunctional aldolase and dehydrogenase)